VLFGKVSHNETASRTTAKLTQVVFNYIKMVTSHCYKMKGSHVVDVSSKPSSSNSISKSSRPNSKSAIPYVLPQHDDTSLLQSTSRIDQDEEYGKDEELLNEFIKKHPMCSLETLTTKVLQTLANATAKMKISMADIPCVPKSYDDKFLCEPDTCIGERECVCRERCLATFIAKVRYGMQNKHGFICKEYLLPNEYEDFLDGKGLPATPKKCLICYRYFTSYLYTLARTNPSISETDSGTVMAQSFCNLFRNQTPTHEAIMGCVDELPLNTPTVATNDGYALHACLFVDEKYADTRIQREKKIGALLFRPTVRFCSKHYMYEIAQDGRKYIVQSGVGVHDTQLSGLSHFRQPSVRGEA
jgi:hypothetical protein